MPTQLTAPVVQQATTATLDAWDISIVRNTDLSLDPARSEFIAVFVFRRADGSILEKRQLSRFGNELPTPVRNAIASLQGALITAARAAGILPAGTDSPDF